MLFGLCYDDDDDSVIIILLTLLLFQFLIYLHTDLTLQWPK